MAQFAHLSMGMTTRLALCFVVCSCGFDPAGIFGGDDSTSSDAAALSGDAGDGSNGDGGATVDAPALVTLRETANDSYAGGAAWCIESAGTVTNDETYERVFRLSDFAISARFHVTAISFLVASSHRADSIAVKVGTYTGGIGASALDTSMMQWLATAPLVNVGDVATPTMQTVAFSPSVPIPTGAVIIASVASPDYAGMGGKTFQLASTSGTEGTPSYWTSVGCQNPTPSKIDVRNGSDVGTFVIDVIGYVQ